jgi:hypothetical protein
MNYIYQVVMNMRFSKRIPVSILVFIGILILSSCSGGKTAVDPDVQMSPVPESQGVVSENTRSAIAAYEMTIDPENFTVDLQPFQREAEFHFNLSGFRPDVLTIAGYGTDPDHNNNFYVDLKLTHPYPGSGISAYDPRIIAIVPARTGVSYAFPSLGMLANKDAMLNPDGFTPLWDSVSPSIPGNNNPYLAYFKGELNRVWASTGKTSETRRMYIKFSGFGGPLTYALVVDVSTGYPKTPTPGRDNAPEPVDCNASITTGMTPEGGYAWVEATLLDWQGYQNTICRIESPELFDGTVSLTYEENGPNPNEYIFSGSISNSKNAPLGWYNVLVAAMDVPTSVRDYWVTKAYVGLENGAWVPDQTRLNVNLTALDDMFPARPGSDLGVIDNDDPEIGGVVMYEAEDMVVKINLDLTTSELHGYSYEPMDADPSNPHPNPEIHPTNRIDAQSNGVVIQSWDDPHYGVGPDLAGQFQREDSLLGIMKPNDTGWLDFLISTFPDMSNDNPSTPRWDESAERPRIADVYEEAETGDGKYVVSAMWAGTVILEEDLLPYPYYPIGAMGGLKDPYFDEDQWLMIMDWGLWILSGPPTNEVVSADASQDPIFPFQFWGFSGPNVAPAAIGIYDKFGGTVDVDLPSDLDANLLDIQLIPKQDPPLNINGILQEIDWIVVLLDNKTIEIIDPYVTRGQTVTIIDLGMLTGDPKYIDVRNGNAEIYVSHTDGTTQYCTVFVLNI